MTAADTEPLPSREGRGLPYPTLIVSPWESPEGARRIRDGPLLIVDRSGSGEVVRGQAIADRLTNEAAEASGRIDAARHDAGSGDDIERQLFGDDDSEEGTR